nr:MAG TPA: hypothetical protein [Caudoviricetes sp.]
MVMAVLIERVCTFLYMQYMSGHALSWCIVFNDLVHCLQRSGASPPKKRTVNPSTHVYFISPITISYKTRTEHA